MRSTAVSSRALVALTLSFTLILGCSLLKKKKGSDNDDPPVANQPTVVVTGSGAKNESDVLRYASETHIPDEPATIGKDGTKAKTFPASGADVATLSKGTTVVKISKFFSTGVLVVFNDPNTGDGTKLMGWIAPETLAPPSATPPPVATFVAPKVAVDAGAKDSGAVVVLVDAGSSGGTTPTVAPGQLLVVPTGGKCPAGMTIVGPFCRRPCITDSQCPKGTFCTNAAGPKTCAATK